MCVCVCVGGGVYAVEWISAREKMYFFLTCAVALLPMCCSPPPSVVLVQLVFT